MATADGERCETCRFWRQDTDGRESPEGWCLRHAPRPSLVLKLGVAPVYAEWPVTFEDDQCGEYQPRTPLPVVG